MGTSLAPQTLLARRYRLETLLVDLGTAQAWRAHDEVLGRDVVVHALPAVDPRADRVLRAARDAAAVTDPRFLRVLDAAVDRAAPADGTGGTGGAGGAGGAGAGTAYVVREWVRGRNLAMLLQDGPLPVAAAGVLAREVAEAVTAAHRAGLCHLRLDPSTIIVADDGAVKVTGLATEAVLRGPECADATREDALGVGRVLYAALTGRWPGVDRSLPPAPRVEGRLASPRQVRAGVPRELDEVADRVLGDPPRRGAPLVEPAAVADALAAVTPATRVRHHLPGVDADATAPAAVPPLPLVGPEGVRSARPSSRRHSGDGSSRSGGPAASAQRPGADPVTGAVAAAAVSRSPVTAGPGAAGGAGPGAGAAPLARAFAPGTPPAPDRPRGERRVSRLVAVLAGALLIAGLVLVGWQLLTSALPGGSAAPGGAAPSAAPVGPDGSPATDDPGSGRDLEIVAARDFDPYGDPPEENPATVPRAVDGQRSTTWSSKTYFDAEGLQATKPGVGLYVDLGSVQDVASVRARLVGTGSALEVRYAPEDARPPRDLAGWSLGASGDALGEQAELDLRSPVRTRYVLLWFTTLPRVSDGYRVGVSEVEVRS